MATVSKTSFNVQCPFCNDEETDITIDLNDMGECRCSGCDLTFTPADAVAKLTQQLRAWQRVDQWVDMATKLLAE